MPRHQEAPRFSPPLPPEPPSETTPEAERSTISSYDEWEDERVIGAELSGQTADRVRLTRCELHRVVLTGAQLRGLALVDVLAVDCELSGTFLHEALLQRVELRNCRMTGIVISQSNLEHVRFVDCKLDEANFRLARGDHVEMSDCSLIDADFYEAVLATSALDGCDLRGGDFTKASVAGPAARPVATRRRARCAEPGWSRGRGRSGAPVGPQPVRRPAHRDPGRRSVSE